MQHLIWVGSGLIFAGGLVGVGVGVAEPAAAAPGRVGVGSGSGLIGSSARRRGASRGRGGAVSRDQAGAGQKKTPARSWGQLFARGGSPSTLAREVERGG